MKKVNNFFPWLDKYSDEFQKGEKILNYLQPTDKKLPIGQKIPLRDTSTELSMSIGGEDGELAYLIPTFKYGQPLKDPVKEFFDSNDVLGGPFKTWQEADEFAKLRHDYVEKGQDIPSPIRWWGKEFKQGGEIKTDNQGYWNPENWGRPVKINSNEITMKGVNQPLLGISNEGEIQYMLPNKDYKFKGKNVTEFPIAQDGAKLPPNAYMVIKGNKRKIINGEMMNTYVPTSDTLYYRDEGQWGENLMGINVPPSLPVDENGKVNIKKKTNDKNKSITELNQLTDLGSGKKLQKGGWLQKYE